MSIKIVKNSLYGSFASTLSFDGDLGEGDIRLSPDELEDGMYVQSLFDRRKIYIVRKSVCKYDILVCRPSHEKSSIFDIFEPIKYRNEDIGWIDGRRSIFFKSSVTMVMNREAKLKKLGL